MEEKREAANFIEAEINKDIANHVYANGRVLTRFPPEPNGYLHIGHVKSICLNFGLGEKYHGATNVRFDDTNPTKENQEFVDSILEDVKWLGFKWKEPVHFASDYFPELYEFACKLIRMGLAYVDDQSSEEIHNTRGDLEHPGKESPWRNRSVEENLKLFQEMKEGKYKDGEKCLRAKIDMASPNLVMRDPVIYRILHATHHRTGDNGAFIHFMISLTLSLMPWKALPIPSAPWNLKKEDLFTTGASRLLTARKSRGRSSLPA